jgi:hypothetical protein
MQGIATLILDRSAIAMRSFYFLAFNVRGTKSRHYFVEGLPLLIPMLPGNTVTDTPIAFLGADPDPPMQSFRLSLFALVGARSLLVGGGRL